MNRAAFSKLNTPHCAIGQPIAKLPEIKRDNKHRDPKIPLIQGTNGETFSLKREQRDE
ncbi:MAG: hypothetical protein ACREJD_12325 [Phycisphaerales bacterium]